MGDHKINCEPPTPAESLAARVLARREGAVKKPLPHGIDDFRKVREGGYYYADKTLMVKEFLEAGGEVTLITRPRRFGKTLNMSMVRDFFDITQDSGSIFDGLDIMKTEYADFINSVPIVYFSFKGCTSKTWPELVIDLKEELYKEYERYRRIMGGYLAQNPSEFIKFNKAFDAILDDHSGDYPIKRAVNALTDAVKFYYKLSPILIIDEYDQPIMSSYEHGYHDEAGDFFSAFYGNAMKGNPSLDRALLTGVQKVAQESIFSKFNNVVVHTVLSERYSQYFGLTEGETRDLLTYYGLKLNEIVSKQYNGYMFSGERIFNPWSILNYADTKKIDYYWTNTSSNTTIKELLKSANSSFLKQFSDMVNDIEVKVEVSLETTYAGDISGSGIWGLLINAGYLTVVRQTTPRLVDVKIPNNEVFEEFKSIMSDMFGKNGSLLEEMFTNLVESKVDKFMEKYKQVVLHCTSFMDATENSYHMLCLGMTFYMLDSYKITSNQEAGDGRYDIRMESKFISRPHVIFEFKMNDSEDLKELSEKALQQIKNKRYDAYLKGDVLCIGIAHSKKKCEASYELCHVREGLLT